MTLGDKIKQRIWRFIYRFSPTFQKWLLKHHIIWHEEGKQRYHIGWLAPGKDLEKMKKHLHDEWGFGNHFIAWVDDGQVLSWRKLIDFKHQYHLRVFEDGEIRGHFEYTPEAHPIYHFKEIGEVDRREDFLKFLGEFAVQEKHISKLTMDPNAYNPDSQITIDQIKK